MYSEKQGVLASMTNGRGRLNRLAYLGRCILLGAISFVLFFIAYSMAGDGVVLKAVGILLLVPGFFLNQQRLHDIGRWMWIAPLYAALSAVQVLTTNYLDIENESSLTPLTIALMVMAIFLLLTKGQSGENEYGPDPLAK